MFGIKKNKNNDIMIKAKVNNTIEINLHFDTGYGDFVLYFPQIKIGQNDQVLDQVFRISDNFEEALTIFNKVILLANAGVHDIYQLYLKGVEFTKKL